MLFSTFLRFSLFLFLLLSPSFLSDFLDSSSSTSLSSFSSLSLFSPRVEFVSAAKAKNKQNTEKSKKKKKKKSNKQEDKNKNNEEKQSIKSESITASSSPTLSRAQTARLSRYQLRRTRVLTRNESIRKLRLQRKQGRKRRISNRIKGRKQFLELQTSANQVNNIKKGIQNAQRMEKLFRRSRGGLISMNNEEFTSLISATPRYYNVFLIFTALGAEHKCKVCSETHTIQRRLARFYNGQRQNFTLEEVKTQFSSLDLSSLSLDLSDFEWKHKELQVVEQINQIKQSFFPVYFVEIDIQQAQKVFWALEIQTAPLIYYLSSSIQKVASSSSDVPKDFLKKIPAKHRYVAMSSITEASLLEFVNGFLMENEKIRTDNEGEEGPKGPLAKVLAAAKDKYSSLDVLTRRFVNVFASVLAVGPVWLLLSFIAVKVGLKSPSSASINESLVSPALRYWTVSASSVASLTFSRAFLIVCSFLLYGFLSGAGMYNTIRGSHLQETSNWWDYRANIVGHQGEQYVIESFIVGSFHLLLASILILMNIRAFKHKDIISESTDENPSFFSRVFRSKALRVTINVLDYLISYFINPLVLLIIFYWIYREYLSCYTKKHEHYLSHIQTRVDALGIYGFLVKQAPKWFWKLWRQWRLLSAAHPTTWQMKDIYNFFVPILMDPMAVIRQLWT
jgi:hypothetical protein